MMELVPGWTLDAQRGPDWLFVHVGAVDGPWVEVSGMAEAIWGLMQQHFTYRIVVELDGLRLMPSSLMGELMRLYKRVQNSGGLMRLSGLSASNRDVLRLTRLDRCFPDYRTREDAVMGIRSEAR